MRRLARQRLGRPALEMGAIILAHRRVHATPLAAELIPLHLQSVICSHRAATAAHRKMAGMPEWQADLDPTDCC